MSIARSSLATKPESTPCSHWLPGPIGLRYANVRLDYRRTCPGDARRGRVPFYHFWIVENHGARVGAIHLRLGRTPHVMNVAGHIGFAIESKHRGHGYAYQACRALAPWATTLMEEVVLTCDPDNLPSRRTIERLDAVYLGDMDVPVWEAAYVRGSRVKRRYVWRLP